MKVLLINIIPYRFDQLIPPMGLLYIASYLRKQGHSVYLFDTNEFIWRVYKRFGIKSIINSFLMREIKEKIKEIKPDFIGFGITFSLYLDLIKELIHGIRRSFSDIPVAVGGANVSSNPSLFMDCADYVVSGEGELILDKILKRKIPVDCKLFSPEKNTELDNLPHPAVDLLNLDIYFDSVHVMPIHGISALRRWFPMITSRGCPYDCIFCSIHSTMGYKWRPRSVENVMDELGILVHKYGIKDILFEDDNISFSAERFYNMCDHIIRGNYKINWYVPNGLRFDTLNKDLLTIMKASGCQEIWIALESGEEETLRNIIKKPIDLNKARKIISLCKEIDIRVSCFFIIGFPGETTNNIYNTLNFIKELRSIGMYRYELSFAAPIPGTKLYDMCLKNNYLMEDREKVGCSATTSKPIIRTSEFDPKTLRKIKDDFIGKRHSLGAQLYLLFQDNIIMSLILDLLNVPYQKLKKIFSRVNKKNKVFNNKR